MIKIQEFIKRAFSNYSVQDNNTLKGVPIVFEQPTDICGLFEETISKSAIDNSILENVDLYYNHNLNSKPLARTKNGRLKLEIKEDGVHMTAQINRERSDANDLYLAIQDGDIDGMSFMFRVSEEEWKDLESDYPKRYITKIDAIREVSVVNEPAYSGTSVDVRSVLDEARSKYNLKNNTVILKKQDNLELEKLKAKYLFNI